jgi:hypothetical protein
MIVSGGMLIKNKSGKECANGIKNILSIDATISENITQSMQKRSQIIKRNVTSS